MDWTFLKLDKGSFILWCCGSKASAFQALNYKTQPINGDVKTTDEHADWLENMCFADLETWRDDYAVM